MARRSQGRRTSAEALERRLLLHAGHGLLASIPIEPVGAVPYAQAAAAATASPRLPDMVPLADLARGYLYGWEVVR
jgi:hypothetical protein